MHDGEKKGRDATVHDVEEKGRDATVHDGEEKGRDATVHDKVNSCGLVLKGSRPTLKEF